MQKIINLKNIEYKDPYNKVSIFDNKNSSLTLISFRAGIGRDIHVDEEDEVAQIIEGHAEVNIGGEVYTLKAGEMIVMPAQTPHGISAIEDTKMLLLRPKHEHRKQSS